MNPRIPQIIADLAQFESSLRQAQSADDINKQLANIKLYAAQLYLETDMEIIAQHREPQIENPEPISEAQEQDKSFFQPSYEDDVETNETATLSNPAFVIENTAIETESLITPPVSFSGEADSRTQESERPAQVNNEINILSEEPIELENALQNEPTMNIDSEPMILDTPPMPTANPFSIQEPEPENASISTELTSEDLNFSQNINTEIELPQATPPVVSPVTPIPDLFSQGDSIHSEPVEIQLDKTTSSASLVHLEQRATEILSMFSFSRRFEFGNFLFGGDMKLFAVFITEMLAVESTNEREDVFDTWYTQRQWSRRDESANDLKRNLKKMM
jgi:hypothetical protein